MLFDSPSWIGMFQRKRYAPFRKQSCSLLPIALLISGVLISNTPAFAEDNLWNPLNWHPVKLLHKIESKVMDSEPTKDAAPKTEKASPAKHDEPVNAEETKSPDDAKSQIQEKKKAHQEKHLFENHSGAVLQTEKGDITLELYPREAPATVKNFTRLVEQGFYNTPDMKFHRVIPGFIIQTGDPTGTGYGGSKQTIPLEVKNKLSHNTKGIVAMARGQTPDSASSQFYITLSKQASLDGKYAIFGRIVQGFDTLDRIEKGDKLYGIKLIDPSQVVHEDPNSSKEKKTTLWESFKSALK